MLSLLYFGLSFCSLRHCKRHVPLLWQSPFRHLVFFVCLCQYSILFRCGTYFSTMTTVAYPTPAISVIPWLNTSLYEQRLMTCLSMCIIVPLLPYSADTAIVPIISSFLQAYSRSNTSGIADRLPPCLQPLFHCFAPSFSELSHFKATYFYHANLAWCCEGAVLLVWPLSQIVRNLPFSSLPPTTKRVLRTIFMVLSHMVPHPCFWLHVKIKFHF